MYRAAAMCRQRPAAGSPAPVISASASAPRSRHATLAANTPMMLKAGLVEGDTDAGVLASGQVVGVIDDLPTCEELVERVVSEAVDCLRRTSGFVVG